MVQIFTRVSVIYCWMSIIKDSAIAVGSGFAHKESRCSDSPQLATVSRRVASPLRLAASLYAAPPSVSFSCRLSLRAFFCLLLVASACSPLSELNVLLCVILNVKKRIKSHLTRNKQKHLLRSGKRTMKVLSHTFNWARMR